MNNIDFILNLFVVNYGKIEYSELQKIAYTAAKETNHPILATFTKSYFGMYSQRVSELIDLLISTNFIDLKTINAKGKHITRYFLTDDGLFCSCLFSERRENE